MLEGTIVTGQYVRISQTPANLGERLLARLIDMIIIVVYVWAMFYAIFYVGMQSGSDNATIILFSFFMLPAIFYSFLFEVFNQGRSPGKKIMNIKVVMKDGTTPSIGSYLLRWLLLPIDINFTSGLGMIFILATKNNQRIGDLAAGTMVIRLNHYRKIHVSLDEYAHLLESYVPAYPAVADLSFEQFNLVRRVLEAEKKNSMYVSQLAQKLKTTLKVNVPTDDRTFLETVVKDYEYFAYVEI